MQYFHFPTPLRLATYLGLVIVVLGILGGAFLMYLRFFTSYYVSGITAAILTIVIMGGVQVVMLGIIGEYIGRIFEESKEGSFILSRKQKFARS